jgi:hypothetical protein
VDSNDFCGTRSIASVRRKIAAWLWGLLRRSRAFQLRNDAPLSKIDSLQNSIDAMLSGAQA